MEFYQLRYNEDTEMLEYHSGGFWFSPTLENPNPVAGITELTGDVTAGPGSGAVAATVALVGGVAASVLAGAIPSADALHLSSSSVDPTITLQSGSDTSIIYQQHNGNHDLIIQNGAGGGFTISRAAGVIRLNTLALYGESNPIRTNADLCAGTEAVDSSAILQADSTTKGFLEPRMTTVQRDAIVSPAEGLEIYDTTTHLPAYWNGSSWIEGASAAGLNTQIQFNSSGAFAGDPNLTWTGSALQLLSSVVTVGDPNSAVSSTVVDAADIQLFEVANPQSGSYIDIDAEATNPHIFIRSHAESSNPSTKAVLQADSTTKGFLPPRMDNTQRDAIASPPEGLTIYSTTDHALEFYNGTTWKQVATV